MVQLFPITLSDIMEFAPIAVPDPIKTDFIIEQDLSIGQKKHIKTTYLTINWLLCKYYGMNAHELRYLGKNCLAIKDTPIASLHPY